MGEYIVYFFNLELKTKNGAGLLYPCLLLNILSPICLSSFSLLGVGLVFSVWIYMVNHYLLSPSSMNIGPVKFCVEFCRMSEGA